MSGVSRPLGRILSQSGVCPGLGLIFPQSMSSSSLTPSLSLSPLSPCFFFAKARVCPSESWIIYRDRLCNASAYKEGGLAVLTALFKNVIGGSTKDGSSRRLLRHLCLRHESLADQTRLNQPGQNFGENETRL